MTGYSGFIPNSPEWRQPQCPRQLNKQTHLWRMPAMDATWQPQHAGVSRHCVEHEKVQTKECTCVIPLEESLGKANLIYRDRKRCRGLPEAGAGGKDCKDYRDLSKVLESFSSLTSIHTHLSKRVRLYS